MIENLKSQQNSVNQIFNPYAFFFFVLTGDNGITMLYTQYLHILHHLQAIKMTFLKLFIFYFHVQGSKISGKIYQFGGKKLNSTEFMEFVFSKSASIPPLPFYGHSKMVFLQLWFPQPPYPISLPFFERQRLENNHRELIYTSNLQPICLFL